MKFRKLLWKSTLSTVLLAGAMVGGLLSAAAAATTPSVLVNGQQIAVTVSPQILNDRLFVPYRDVVPALGGTVTWDEATKAVTATKEGTRIVTTAGSTTAYINDRPVTLEAAPVIVQDTTLVPVRLIAEAFGSWVKWDQAKQQAVIDTSITVETKGGPVTLTQRPERIVTLSSSDTEIVYALGGTVVGRPTASGPVIPAAAAPAAEVGTAHGINFEVLASLKPDLVIGNPSLQPHVATVEGLGAKFVLNSHVTLPEIKASIQLYGKLLGREEQVDALIAQFDRQLAEVTRQQPATKPKALIVYGAPGTFLLALPSSYPGNFLEAAGGVNVAADFPKMANMPQYAEFSLERIIAANPDVIYLITHGDPAAVMESFKKELESNPAWNGLTAVKNEQFQVLPTLFAANPGLRAPDAVKYLNDSLQQVKRP